MAYETLPIVAHGGWRRWSTWLAWVVLTTALVGGAWALNIYSHFNDTSNLGAAAQWLILGAGTSVAGLSAWVMKRTERGDFWHAQGRTFTMLGGLMIVYSFYTLVGNALDSLVWERFLPFVLITYSLVAWRTLGGINRGIAWRGVAFGLVLSSAVGVTWVIYGDLGTRFEFAEVILQSSAIGLTLAMLLNMLIPADFQNHYPRRSILMTGLGGIALSAGVLLYHPFEVQAVSVLVMLAPMGFVAGVLMSVQSSGKKSSLWTVWALFVPMLIIFNSFTEGIHAEYIIENTLHHWMEGTAIATGVGVGLALIGLLAFGAVKAIYKQPRWIFAALALSSTGVATVFANTNDDGFQSNYVFAIMKSQVDTSAALQIDDINERRAYVYNTLVDHANETQSDLRSWLDSQGKEYTPYYLVNGVEVDGGVAMRRQLEARDDVDRVIDSPRINALPQWFEPTINNNDPEPAPADYTYGLELINAPQVWQELGVTGEGIVVGSADTGVDWTHPAIAEKYRGADGNHDYNWFDPWFFTEAPIDTNGHGTHTVGTMVGANNIGVAPDAQWIGCRNLARSFGNAAYYLGCMQFLFAPYPIGGDAFTQGDPTQGAHIVNNSWGCPQVERCDDRTLPIALRNLANGGQFNAFAAGNSGPRCSTIGNPAFTDAVLAAGAVNSNGELTNFSSRGPVILTDGTRIKPDLAAPGFQVKSSVPGGKYQSYSGTSMASPHMAGVLALIWSANPELIGDIEATYTIITTNTRPVELGGGNPVCGEAGVPNNLYGMGVLDAYQSVSAAQDAAQQAYGVTSYSAPTLRYGH